MESNPLKAYKETQIKTATQGQLIIMLYDGAIKNLNIAIEELKKKSKKLDRVSNGIIKAQDIISELMVSLDFEQGGEIARNLFSIYIYMNRELLNANIKKDYKPLGAVKTMLMELRDAWNQIVDKVNLENSTARPGGGINIAG
ncbi:MAG: flagellar export chaperone FliS [Spirochaetales bacterium]|nr:flagellar export chaperone FliS [Spirochaetales bacterium]